MRRGHAAMLRPLLGRKAWPRWPRCWRSRPLLAFDFDGTLAPIVARPDDVRVSAPIARRLERSRSVLPVAIVTGRSIDDVRGRLGFVPPFDRRQPRRRGRRRPPATTRCRAALDALARASARARRRAGGAGVVVEDKRQSLALHYRLARDRERAPAP